MMGRHVSNPELAWDFEGQQWGSFPTGGMGEETRFHAGDSAHQRCEDKRPTQYVENRQLSIQVARGQAGPKLGKGPPGQVGSVG